MVYSKYNYYRSVDMTKEERNQRIIEMYEEGYNTVTIAKKLDVDPSTVQRFLKKEGIILKRRSTELKPNEWSDIVSRFNNGERISSIYRRYEHHFKCPETLSKMLKREGIKTEKLTGGFDRKAVDENYFTHINSKDKAYFLGLLIADGGLTSQRHAIALELKAEDKYMLEHFKAHLKSDHAIIQTRSCYRFSFTSPTMFLDLAKYGVIPNKTNDTYLPILEEKYMPDLIRGIFDGDGTVYKRNDKDGVVRLSFGFYGSERILMELRNYLHDKLNLPNNKIHQKTGCSMLYYGKNQSICDFYNYIYKDADVFLIRKKKLFEQYIANIERACIASLCNA